MSDIPVGIHLGIEEDVYHSFVAASNSNLSTIKTSSPAHLKWTLDNRSEGPRSDAFKIGSAAHSAILEPDMFEGLWGKAPEKLDRRTRAGKELWADLQEEYGGNILKADHYNAVLGMRDSVYAMSTARALLEAAGEAEVTLVWDDEETGVRCKARVDRLPASSMIGVVDLKTTKDASPKSMAKSVWAYGYYRQSSHYLSGLRHLGDPRDSFRFICVEKEKPFACAVYRIDEGSIDAGEAELKKLLRTYKICSETGFWPAYPDEEIDLAIPPWAFSEIDREK